MKKAIKTILTIGTIAISTISCSTMNMQVKTDYEAQMKAKELKAIEYYKNHVAKWSNMRANHDANTCEMCQSVDDDNFGTDYYYAVCMSDPASPHFCADDEEAELIAWYVENN